jgi:hypothetical protein
LGHGGPVGGESGVPEDVDPDGEDVDDDDPMRLTINTNASTASTKMANVAKLIVARPPPSVHGTSFSPKQARTSITESEDLWNGTLV